MKKNLKFHHRKNQSGLAILETLPILIIFIILLSYGLGFFGVVHTGILNSIAARTYAFETFRNRANLEYFRDTGSIPISSSKGILYTPVGNRTHAINDENAVEEVAGISTGRNIAFGREVERSTASSVDHNERVFNIAGRNRQGGVEVSPVWIMVGYGICLNAGCGD